MMTRSILPVLLLTFGCRSRDGEVVDTGDVSALFCLCTVGGDLTIETGRSSSMARMALLSEVGGDLSITGSGILVNLGLAGLTTIGGDFSLTDNPRLTTINSVSGVDSIGHDVEILDNHALSTAEIEAMFYDSIGIDNIEGNDSD